MFKYLYVILICLIVTNVFAQSEKIADKNASDQFEKDYNQGNYDSIFSSFAAVMQAALPREKTVEFFTNLKIQAGQILQKQFLKSQATYASYKTNFERALLTLNLSLDEHLKINGLFIKPFTDETLPMPKRNLTKMILPFRDEWTVIWGGDTKELNYHVESQAQKNAFDLVITGSNGKTYRTNGQKNEDYFAFGKELFSPCDGEVVLVVDGVKDNTPGELNPIYVPGNSIIIKTLNNEYLVFAHFKQHSIILKQGAKVHQGQLLGQCGNSGNSSEPHLHYHIQNVENMNVATGVKCYFTNIIVNGQVKSDYSPVQHEKIKNI